MNPCRISLLALPVLFAGAAGFAQEPTPTPSPSGLPGFHVPMLASWGDQSHQAQLQSKSAQLVQQLMKAEKTEDKADIKKKLTEVLNEQFDLRLKQQEKELADLEKEIASLRAVLKKRQDAKSAIVDRRIEQLVQEAEGLGWTSPGRSQFYFNWSDIGHAPAPPAVPTPAPRKP
jgi:hypothetical protein